MIMFRCKYNIYVSSDHTFTKDVIYNGRMSDKENKMYYIKDNAGNERIFTLDKYFENFEIIGMLNK